MINAEETTQQRRPLKHLAVAADNCSGQNKNKAVIKFCCWLAEANFATKVTLLFLIKGHTKNDCDREFNLLKEGQDGEDIWTADELDEALTKKNSETISLSCLSANHFNGWTEGLNHYYRDPPSGTILIKPHIYLRRRFNGDNIFKTGISRCGKGGV